MASDYAAAADSPISTVGWNGATNAGRSGTYEARGTSIDTTGTNDSTSGLNELFGNITAGTKILLPDNAIYSIDAGLTLPVRVHLTGGGKLNFTTAAAVNAAINVTADGTIFEGVKMFNSSRLNTQVGQPKAILVDGNDFQLIGCLIDSFPGGCYVDANGEWSNTIMIGNRVKDILGVGNGPVSSSSNGEAGGDGLYTWGGQATITGNVVNCAGQNWRPKWTVPTGTLVCTFVDNYLYVCSTAGTTGTSTPTWPGTINATVTDGTVVWTCVCLGGDARIGIGHEQLAVYEGTQPAAHPDSLSAITGNVIYGKFRRNIAVEGVNGIAITGNTLADATWWSIDLSYPIAATAADNAIFWTRTSADQQGSTWSPSRAPLTVWGAARSSSLHNNSVHLRANSAAEAIGQFFGSSGSAAQASDISHNRAYISPLASVVDAWRGLYDSGCSFVNNTTRGPLTGPVIYRYSSLESRDEGNRHFQGGLTPQTAIEGAIAYNGAARSLHCRGNHIKGNGAVGIAAIGASGRVESNDIDPVGTVRQITDGHQTGIYLTSASATFVAGTDISIVPLGIAPNIWAASSYQVPENVVAPTTPNGLLYIALTQGNTGSTQPTWPTSVGGQVWDGAVLWQAIPGGDLADAFHINTVYTASGAPAWAASTAYGAGQMVRPTSANTHLYQVTTAGTSGTSQPTWPTTAGATVTDGGVTWTCLATGVTGISSFDLYSEMDLESVITTGYWAIVTNTGTIIVDGYGSDTLAVINNLAYGRAAATVNNVSNGTNGCIVAGNA